jgi:succinate dehydrogenase / fumarate reductase flavoprotein subunit
VLPTVHYNMGGIPTNYHGEVLNPTAAIRMRIVPGLMAVGEAACASVHGANRLGSNSLTDLVVFGRAAALRAAKTIDKPGRYRPRSRRPCDEIAGSLRPPAQRQWRHADRRAAREDAAHHAGRRRRVPHLGIAAEGGRASAWQDLRRLRDIKVTDRSMIWNSDLVETLELKT